MKERWFKLVDGLTTYCEKNNFKKVLLGLSGGLDSAFVAVLAADALGGDNVKAFMLPTKYTSNLSLELAKQVAELNKLDYEVFDIQALVDFNLEQKREMFHTEISNVVEENTQSRIRGELLWGYSNQFGNLLLACGNRSEASIGNCTLGGDTAGGLMPIGNVLKSDIFAISKWRNTQSNVMPEMIISRPPSAELKHNQKDEDLFPPYDVLDPILYAYLDCDCSIEAITGGGYDYETVAKVIERYHWAAFKRLQMPEILEYGFKPTWVK